jgi:hypothetical protein
LIAVRKLNASSFERAADCCNCVSGHLTPRPFEIDDGRQAKARSLRKLRLCQVEKRATGAALCWRHFNIFC